MLLKTRRKVILYDQLDIQKYLHQAQRQVFNWCSIAKMITCQLKRLAHRAS